MILTVRQVTVSGRSCLSARVAFFFLFFFLIPLLLCCNGFRQFSLHAASLVLSNRSPRREKRRYPSSNQSAGRWRFLRGLRGWFERMDGSQTFYLRSLSPLTPRCHSWLAQDPDVLGPGEARDWTVGAPLLSGLTSRGQLVVSQSCATAHETNEQLLITKLTQNECDDLQ